MHSIKNQAIGRRVKSEWTREPGKDMKTAGQSTKFVACPSPRFSPSPISTSHYFPTPTTHPRECHEAENWVKSFSFTLTPAILCWYINFPVEWKAFLVRFSISITNYPCPPIKILGGSTWVEDFPMYVENFYLKAVTLWISGHPQQHFKLKLKRT